VIRRVLAAAFLVTLVAGCATTGRSSSPTTKAIGSPTSGGIASSSAAATTSSTTARPAASTTTARATSTTSTTGRATTTTTTRVPALGGTPIPSGTGGGPRTFPPTGAGPLAGKIVAVDPGHNGGNFEDPSYIDHLIFNGREEEACDTTGTATNSGYTESLFNWNVAQDLTAILRSEGATVVLTRTSNAGVGPCVTQRAAIGNNAHAGAAVSIHADGGPPSGRGFTILEPIADGPNDGIITASGVLGTDLRNAFAAGTGEPVSNYDGVAGIQSRDDLGGTNLSTVPKVFVECANMRNSVDAALVVSTAWQETAARAIAAGLSTFLTGR
jgi:N-acetylmuramoyl-L-alanine amidase